MTRNLLSGILFLNLFSACATAEPPPAEKKEAAPPPAEKAPAKAKAEAEPEAAAAEPADPEVLARLDPAKAVETAPESFQVVFDTTEGEFTVEVKRSDAPKGADRLYNLVKMGYFDDVAFFRAIDGFMVQFGLHGEPGINQSWRQARIDDDPVALSNERGTLTFATSGPNTRTTQMFLNFVDNKNLDKMGFSPVGKVVSGMEVVDKLYTGYGEGAPKGKGPDQRMIHTRGNSYLKSQFPELDYIRSAKIAGG